MSKRTLYYVVSTHWDREWYETFQNYRYKLIDMLNEVLDGFEMKELHGPFHLDGQACMLEDYLEIEPDKKDVIYKRLSEGLISAGPWYVLPDEFLISGESMIRNFRLGHETVRKLGGKPSKAGYLSDMFGHISQMPQIMKGFGIKAAFVWRGTDHEQRNIIWEGADNTRIPTYVFSPYGYGEYSLFVRQVDKDFYSDFTIDGFAKRVEKFVEQECNENTIAPVLIFDGVDLLCWDKVSYRAFFDHFKEDKRFDIEYVDLDGYMNEMIANYSNVKKTLKGELSEVATNFVNDNNHHLYGTLSSRVDIKQENTVCQNSLTSWAEPFSVLANQITGQKYPKGFLDVAWKWLIKNHPHDSICGCSIDQVHKDMEFRFSQSRQISERLTKEALKIIGASVDIKTEEDQIKLVIFNPLQHEIDEVVSIPVQIPTDWPYFFEFLGFENLPIFRVYDVNENEIAYQRLSQELNIKNVHTFKTKVPHAYDTTQVNIALLLHIPATGYKTLVIKKAKQGEPVRHPNDHKIAHSGNILENKILKATVQENGTVNLLDKRNNQEYKNLLTFEENADIGNGWFHGIAINDETVYSKTGKSQISATNNGPELATLKIKTTLSLPQNFDFTAMKRSEVVKDFIITSKITLRKDSDHLEVETVVDNNICDHRLRVVFPSDASCSMYLTDSLFDVVERNIKLPKDNYIKKELQVDTRSQQSWTAIFDNIRGLAIVTTGLYETAVSNEPSNPIKLTLFRSFKKTVMTNGEMDCQLLKQLKFKYNIMPITGNINRERLFIEASKIANGLKTMQFRCHDIASIKPTEKLLAENSFIKLTGSVLTGIYKFNGQTEIRFFNPEEKASNAIVTIDNSQLKSKISKAWKVDFESNKLGEEYVFSEECFKINIKPKEIVTLVIK